MAISLVGATVNAQGQSNLTTSFPTGWQAGDLAVIVTAAGTPSNSLPDIPAGWTLVASGSGGGSVWGNQTGPRRLSFFAKELVAGDTPPVIFNGGGTGAVHQGRTFVFRKTQGTWAYAASTGEDLEGSTQVRATLQQALGFTPGSVAVIAGATADADIISLSMTVTGATVGPATNFSAANTVQGNDQSIGSAWVTISGTSNVAPTVTAGLAKPDDGVVGAIRISEGTATVSVQVGYADEMDEAPALTELGTASGTGSLTATVAISSTGVKGAAGALSLVANVTLTADAVGGFSGTGSLVATVTGPVSTGRKGGRSTAALTGTVTISPATVRKGARGQLALTASVSLTGAGGRSDSGKAAGAGSITADVILEATGFRSALGEALLIDAFVELLAEGTRTAEGTADLTAEVILEVKGFRSRWIFSPPTVREVPAHLKRHRLFGRVYLDVGVTVLRFGGSFKPVRDPSPEELVAADAIYIGGHEHFVSDEEYIALMAAGYGPYLRPERHSA